MLWSSKERVNQFNNEYVQLRDLRQTGRYGWLLFVILATMIGTPFINVKLVNRKPDITKEQKVKAYDNLFWLSVAIVVLEYIIGVVIIRKKSISKLNEFYEQLATKYIELSKNKQDSELAQHILSNKRIDKKRAMVFRNMLVSNMLDKDIYRLDSIAWHIYEYKIVVGDDDKFRMLTDEEINELLSEANDIISKYLRNDSDLFNTLYTLYKEKKLYANNMDFMNKQMKTNQR
ncbi:MAG: hypothetical protein MJ158_02865 [Alphaproteobacteria bacterium]|nr:hypothetical protein [Alphaproteobacteria bacterium]